MTTVVSVELNPFAGGLLRAWTDTGSQLWQVWNGDALEVAMGRGRLARTEAQFRCPKGYRQLPQLLAVLEEAGAIQPGTGSLAHRVAVCTYAAPTRRSHSPQCNDHRTSS